MVDPNYALQSQQFAQDAANQGRQRSIAYDEMAQRPWLQLPQTMQNQQALNQQSRAQGFRERQAMQQQAMQQRELQMEEAQSSERINSMQMERAVAAEALAWSRELHTTDMLALQRRSADAQTRMIEMQADEAAKKANLPQVPRGLDQETILLMKKSGFKLGMSNGRFEVKMGTPEEQATLRKEAEDYEQRQIKAQEAHIRLMESQAQEKESRAGYYEKGGNPRISESEPRLLLQTQLRAIERELGNKELTPERRAELMTLHNERLDELNSIGEDNHSAGEDLHKSIMDAFNSLKGLETGRGE